jgi:DNA invertase Pin-like site-specific DNA recombinase
MTRCAAYLRISKDDEGLGLGIDRQWQAVSELAASKGWTIDPL